MLVTENLRVALRTGWDSWLLEDYPSSSATTELWVSITGSHGLFSWMLQVLSITSISSIQNWKEKDMESVGMQGVGPLSWESNCVTVGNKIFTVSLEQL